MPNTISIPKMDLLNNNFPKFAAAIFSIIVFTLPAYASEVWKTLPPPADTPQPTATGFVHVMDADIYFSIHGAGEPIILLHGGLGNTGYWGSQIAALSEQYKVISIDSRGHGRSTRSDQPYTYHLMASDVLAVMDALEIPKARMVGWSDGGNIGLDIAINNPNRLVALFAFGANFHPSGLIPYTQTPPTLDTYTERAKADYRRLSATPDGFDDFTTQLDEMWEKEPNFTAGELRSISVPVAVAIGEFDEVISLEHTTTLAAMIPKARLIIIPGLSHFGLWQDPIKFNNSVLKYFSKN